MKKFGTWGKDKILGLKKSSNENAQKCLKIKNFSPQVKNKIYRKLVETFHAY